MKVIYLFHHFPSGNIITQNLEDASTSNLTFKEGTGSGIPDLSFNGCATLVCGICDGHLKVGKLENNAEDITMHALSLTNVSSHAWPCFGTAHISDAIPDNELLVGTMEGDLLHIEVLESDVSEHNVKRSLLDSRHPSAVSVVAWRADGTIVNKLPGYEKGCVVAGFADGMLIACSIDGSVIPRKLKISSEGIRVIEFDPSGTCFAVLSRSHVVRVLVLADSSLVPLHKLEFEKHVPTLLTWKPVKELEKHFELCVGYENGVVNLWRFLKPRKHTEHDFQVSSCVWISN